MLADNLATHLQNLYIVCGTVIPVPFVALAVQVPSTRVRALPLNLGAYVMVLGQIAALAVLVFAWTSVVAEVFADSSNPRWASTRRSLTSGTCGGRLMPQA